MSSSVEDQFAAVRDEYQSLSSDTTTVWQYGAAQLSRQYGSARRVVCVRRNETLEPATQAGRGVGSARERRLTTARRSAVEWHLFGPDEEAVEALATNLITTMFELYGRAQQTMSLDSIEWPSEVSGATSDLPYAILRTTMVFNVPGEIIELPVQTVDTFGHTGEFDGEEVC